MGAGDNVICQVLHVLQEVSSFRAKPTSISQPIDLVDDDDEYQADESSSESSASSCEEDGGGPSTPRGGIHPSAAPITPSPAKPKPPTVKVRTFVDSLSVGEVAQCSECVMISMKCVFTCTGGYEWS